MSVIHIDKNSFEKITKQTAQPVLVDFWATWCGPCQMLAPELEALSAEYPNLIVAKVDVDQEQDLAIQMGIDSIPALFFYRDGKLVKRSLGYKDKSALIAEFGL